MQGIGAYLACNTSGKADHATEAQILHDWPAELYEGLGAVHWLSLLLPSEAQQGIGRLAGGSME